MSMPPDTPSIAPPPSRNTPCPCGSGQRYKDCHGALGSAVDTARGPAAAGTVASGADALLARARVELARNDTSAAAASCRAALGIANSPDATVAAWNMLGETLRASDPVAAEAAWRHAIEVEPDDAEANFHLGNLQRERGAAGEAIRSYEHALRRAPNHSGLLNNLGLAHEAEGDFDRAETCYRAVLRAEPQHADALANLGNVLYERERYVESAKIYDQVFAIRRDVPTPIWIRRGIAQDRARDYAGAAASFAEAARRSPDDLQVHVNLITQQMGLGRYADAEPTLVRTLELDPGNAYALSMLAHARQHRCVWKGLDSLFDDVNRALDAPPRVDGRYTVNPFPLLAIPASPQAQLRAAQRWAATMAPTQSAIARQQPAPLGVANERLRVGFVSSDFREHPMAHLSMEYWERLDRDRIEAYAYGLQATDRGPIGQRITAAFEHFHDVSRETSSEIAQRVRADNISILIDLNGYTAHGDTMLFALRAAPVQVNMIGFPGTLGVDWYDYILVDRFGAPDAAQPFYTERLWQMPNSSYPSDTTRAPAGAPPGRRECGLPERGFVFCCFNKSFKILPAVFAIWMRLLDAVPGSVLWLLSSSEEATANLLREAGAAGIDPTRLIFAPKVPQQQHLARHRAADLFLDSYPYGAHTTTNDALLAGLPVVTCAGDTLVTRLAGSQLNAIGLPELVTASLKDYEAMALHLARDPTALASIRERLASNKRSYSLFDMARYTRDFENGLDAIWRTHTDAISSA